MLKSILAHIKAVDTMTEQFFVPTQEQKDLVTVGMNARALLSLNGNKVEKVCASYILINQKAVNNTSSFLLISGAMQLAKAHRIGYFKAVLQDFTIATASSAIFMIKKAM